MGYWAGIEGEWRAGLTVLSWEGGRVTIYWNATICEMSSIHQMHAKSLQ